MDPKTLELIVKLIQAVLALLAHLRAQPSLAEKASAEEQVKLVLAAVVKEMEKP
jgi:hypothetical protein